MTTSPRPACRRLSTDVRRAGLAAVTAVCVWVIAGCTTDVGGADHPGRTAVATPAETTLETLLLDDPDIARITDAPGLHTADSYRTMPDAAAGRTYSDAFCGAAISAASTTAYDASSANDVRGRRLDDTDTAGAVQRAALSIRLSSPSPMRVRRGVRRRRPHRVGGLAQA